MCQKQNKRIKTTLIEAQNYCDAEDKSTEFMLQYMSDALTEQGLASDFYEAHDMVIAFLSN